MDVERDLASDIEFDVERDLTLDPAQLYFSTEVGIAGRGNFATIFRARHRGEDVAVKVQRMRLPKSRCSGSDLVELDGEDGCQVRELAVLKCVAHPNLVRFVGAASVDLVRLPLPLRASLEMEAEASDATEPSSRAALLIVTEWMAGGDLLQLLLGDTELGWQQRVGLLRDAARGLAHLHSRGVIHRDVKSANILVDATLRHCKLCDHGLARPQATSAIREKHAALLEAQSPPPCDSTSAAGRGAVIKTERPSPRSRARSKRHLERHRRLSICGTEQYMAPELLYSQQDYTEAVDVFGLGLAVVETIMRHPVPAVYLGATDAGRSTSAGARASLAPNRTCDVGGDVAARVSGSLQRSFV